MAISASSERRELVLSSIGATLHDTIAGLLNAIIAHCLPARSDASRPVNEGCDRSISVTAQATSLHLALTELIGDLLESIEVEEGAIDGVDLHGVMTGPDRCTIWAQACLDTPTPYVPLVLSGLTVEQVPGEISIAATLRDGE